MVTENARRLSDTPAEGVDMLWRLPKVELHLHLEGAMRPATVCAQARRYESNSPFCHDGWQAGFWSFSDLTTALAALRQVTRVALRSADDYYLIARECFEDLAAQQVIYAMVWRGAVAYPPFLTGRSMIIAGGMQAKLVLYPIAHQTSTPGTNLLNWAVTAKLGDGSEPPPRREVNR